MRSEIHSTAGAAILRIDLKMLQAAKNMPVTA